MEGLKFNFWRGLHIKENIRAVWSALLFAALDKSAFLVVIKLVRSNWINAHKLCPLSKR